MLKFITKYKYVIGLLIILSLGLYLRFHGYESDPNRMFGWDQARDAWKTRDILQGQLVLDGPKTGIGNLHLGPLYFYLLAPFYFFTKLDPVGSLYFLIVANIINFLIVYFVSARIFSQKAALFAVFLFAVSNYIIKQSSIPWNVSLVPGVSLLIFYGLYQIKTASKTYWYYIIGLLMGFFLHLHFTAVFFPVIIGLTLFPYDRDWKKLRYLAMTYLLAGLFLIPVLVFNFQQSQGEYYRYTDFISNYTHGFYVQFFLSRLSESFVQFKTITYFPFNIVVQFLLPILFFLTVFFEKRKQMKLFGLLMVPWFVVPVIAFTLYAGPISDYYFYFQMPLIILMLIYLQIKLLHLSPKLLFLLIPLWLVYAYANTQEFWVKRTDGGLNKSKREALPFAKEGRMIQYHEGDIKSYLYEVWTEDYPPDDSVKY